ncbi:MAG: TerD family protein [bacterium]|nr:TerD family protein [bacterium]
MVTVKSTDKQGKTATRQLNTLLVGLGWDEAQHSLLNRLRGLISGSSEAAPDLDLDLSLVVFGEDGELYDVDPRRSFVYHDNLKLFGAIKHHGNNRTGEGDGCDEYITINFEFLPEDVGKMTAVVNITNSIRRKQDFTQAGNAYITLIDFDKMEEICTLKLNKVSNIGMAGVFAFDIERTGKNWNCKVIDKPCKTADKAISMFQHYLDEGLNRSLDIAFRQAAKHRGL